MNTKLHEQATAGLKNAGEVFKIAEGIKCPTVAELKGKGKLYAKFAPTVALVAAMKIQGGFSLNEIAGAAKIICDELHITYGSKHIHDFENVLNEAISKSTRPVDHAKNCWGVNACKGVDGTFSQANFKSKHGVKSITLARHAEKSGGVSKYAELSALHKTNTKKHGAYTSAEYRQVVARRRAELEKKRAEAKQAQAQAQAKLAEIAEPTAKQLEKVKPLTAAELKATAKQAADVKAKAKAKGLV